MEYLAHALRTLPSRPAARPEPAAGSSTAPSSNLQKYETKYSSFTLTQLTAKLERLLGSKKKDHPNAPCFSGNFAKILAK